MNGHRLSQPFEHHAFLFGMLILEAKSRQIVFSSTVHNGDMSRSQPARSIGCIDGRVARAHYNDVVSNLEMARGLVSCDELQRVHDVGMIRPRNTKRVHCAQPYSHED